MSLAHIYSICCLRSSVAAIPRTKLLDNALILIAGQCLSNCKASLQLLRRKLLILPEFVRQFSGGLAIVS